MWLCLVALPYLLACLQLVVEVVAGVVAAVDMEVVSYPVMAWLLLVADGSL
jgi:hypothetical protein